MGNEQNNISLHTFRATRLGLTQYFLGSLWWHLVDVNVNVSVDVNVDVNVNVVAFVLDVLKHAYENVGF